MIKEWMWPTFGAFLVWGLWGFLPKLTTRYLDTKSAIVYEVFGAMLLGAIALFQLNFQLDVNPRGIALEDVLKVFWGQNSCQSPDHEPDHSNVNQRL